MKKIVITLAGAALAFAAPAAADNIPTWDSSTSTSMPDNSSVTDYGGNEYHAPDSGTVVDQNGNEYHTTDNGTAVTDQNGYKYPYVGGVIVVPGDGDDY
jgi:hypothetical protein